jgi:LysM repeat protein
MPRLLRHVACLFFVLLTAASCAPLTALVPATATSSLMPWPTSTVTQDRATQVPTVPATIQPGPSATPFKHVVEQGETFLGIAALYGVGEDDLFVANPGIDPDLLSIGQELLIPGPEGTPIGSLIPTSTPIPLALQTPSCFPRPSGGAWCIAGIHNPTTQDLENLVVEIRTKDKTGEVVHSVEVFPPLNRLPAGETMPVAAAFEEGVPEGGSASARVLSVIPARDADERYRVPQIERTTDERQPGGLSWLIGGTIEGSLEGTLPNRTLVLLTGYDDDGRVAGYAVWEADPPLEPGEVRDFAVRVFSLGPELARVELMAESYSLAAE